MAYYLVTGLLLVCGVVLLAGAILDWKWLTTREKERPKGIGNFVHKQFGEKGYRIAVGVGGAVTIFAAVALILA